MISEEYRALNAQLHQDNETYGTSGQSYANDIAGLALASDINTILDYGAGKGTLKKTLASLNIIEYDPCIPELNIKPEPADLVVCTDVLEHIEPEFVDDVVADLKRLTKMCLYLFVATGPACKCLADGRNAHVSIHPKEWWLDKFSDMELISCEDTGKGFIAVLT